MKTVRCTCRSHCTVLDPSTGIYGGEGHVIPRSTHTRHLKDDRLHTLRTKVKSFSARLRRSSSPGTPPNLPSQSNPLHASSSEHDIQPNQINIIKIEVLLYSEQPVTSQLLPLQFSNYPATSGPFIWPTPAEILFPNTGLYRLQTGPQVNSVFLTTENRLCHLASLV